MFLITGSGINNVRRLISLKLMKCLSLSQEAHQNKNAFPFSGERGEDKLAPTPWGSRRTQSYVCMLGSLYGLSALRSELLPLAAGLNVQVWGVPGQGSWFSVMPTPFSSWKLS